MRKKASSIFLLLLLCFQTFSIPAVSVASNEEKTAYMTFGTEGKISNVKAWMSDRPEVVEHRGKTGWKLIGSVDAKQYIYFDIEDSFMNKLCGESVYVDVEYFDEGHNVFLLEYDSEARIDQHTEYVDTRNTLIWKTHTFFLQDAFFDNRLELADLRIAAASDNLGNGGSILIGSINIRYGKKKSPIEITLSSEAPGNIFLEGEDIAFKAAYRNRTDESYQYTVQYQALNIEHTVLWTDERPLFLAGGESNTHTLTFQMPEFGLHWLRVELLDESGRSYCIKDAEFSYVTSGRLNYKSGTSTHTDMHITKFGDDTEVSRILAGVGYGNIRFSWMWYYYEQERGSYVLQPHWKKLMKLYSEKDVDIIAIVPLTYGYGTAYSEDSGFSPGPITPLYRAQMKAMVRQLVKDSKDYVKFYIMGNEPDHPGIYTDEERNPKYVVQRMEIVYNTIKEEYPEAIVAGLAPTMVDIDWIRKVFAEGAGKYMDVATMHPYSAHKTLEDSGYVSRMQEIHQIAADNGCKDLPIWITENGWIKGRSGLRSIDLYVESQQLVRMNIYSEAYGLADKVVDYLLTSQNISKKSSIGYGHIAPGPDGTSDEDLPYAAFRSYVTLAAWNKNFGGDCEIEACYDEGNIKAYQFKRLSDGKRFFSMWTIEGRENISLSLNTDKVQLMDCFGNSSELHGVNGRYTFNLNEDTTYVIGDFTTAKRLETPVFSPSHLVGECTFKSERTVSIESGNLPEGCTLTAECYGNAVVAEDAVFKDGKATLTYTLKEKAKEKSWDYLCGKPGRSQQINTKLNAITDYMILSVKKDADVLYRMKLPIKQKEPVSIECRVYPFSRDFLEKWVAEFIIRNEENSQTDGIFNITSPTAWATGYKPLSLSLAPGEAKQLLINIPEKVIDEKLLLGAEVLDENQQPIEHFTQEYATSCAIYTTTPPVIDGRLDDSEWYERSALTVKPDSYTALMKSEQYTGEDDLSAKLMFQWDDEFLYFAARVKDDIHKQPYRDNSTWQADGFQMGFAVSGEGATFSHIMLALSDDGYETLYSFASEDSSYPKGVIEGGEIKCIREGKETVYEAKIPMSAIMPLKNSVTVGDGVAASGVFSSSDERYKPENGTTLKFSALINDDDGVGRKGFIQYGKGVSDGTSANFPRLYFLK